MGIITDILSGIPVNAVLQQKLDSIEEKYEALEAENSKLKQENQQLKTRLAEFDDTGLDNDHVKILQLLASCERHLSANEVAAQLDLNPTKAKFYLDGMMYTIPACITAGQPRYRLTQGGRQYLVENDLLD